MTEDVTIQGRDQEAALIGSILRKPAILDEMQETIKPDHFQYIPYRNVWEAMVELRTREMGIDTITVGDELERRGCLNNWSLHDKASSSGRVALTFLRELGQPINAKSYADNIIDYAAKRAAFQIINKAANWLQSGRRAGDILQDIEKQLSEIATTDSKASKHTMAISEAVTSAYLVTDSASQGNKNYIETGYKDIDNLITGLCAPDFTLVAARPGQGKTAFLASVIHNIINISTGIKIAFFSLEMSNEQVAMRFISMESGIPYSKQYKGNLSEKEWQQYGEAKDNLLSRNDQIYINDLPSISPNKIRQELRRIGQVDLVVVDYLQLATSDTKAENRALEVGNISRGLKAICKEFNVPMLCAAQLNRAATQRSGDNQRPILTDLGESGSLERDADNIIFLHRDAMASNSCEVIIAKQRNGPVGLCHLAFIPQKTRFESAAKVGY